MEYIHDRSKSSFDHVGKLAFGRVTLNLQKSVCVTEDLSIEQSADVNRNRKIAISSQQDAKNIQG